MQTLPSMQNVADRIKTIQKEKNGKALNQILIMVSKELSACWKNQDVPFQSNTTITNKLKRFHKTKKGKSCFFN